MITTQEITNAATEKTTKPVRKISLKEYLKSIVFLAAIYSLIINQAQQDKAENVEKETIYQRNQQAETRDRQMVLPSLVYSGMTIIFYPTHLLWK